MEPLSGNHRFHPDDTLTLQTPSVNVVDDRPRILLTLDGIDVDFLYDSGAIGTCMKWDTFLRFFKHKTLVKDPNRDHVAAGNISLGYMGTIQFPVVVKGKTHWVSFDVCERINDNCLGIHYIQQMELNYSGASNTIYALSTEENTDAEGHLALTEETYFAAHTVSLIKLSIIGERFRNPDGTRMMAYIQAASEPMIGGGPALISISDQGECWVAITNAAPY